MTESSGRTLEKDIRELCATAALLLNDPPPTKIKAAPKQSARSRPSYRRHESYPCYSGSPHDNELDQESISHFNSISLPPPPQTRPRSRSRSAQELQPSMRHGSPNRRSNSRHRQTSRGRAPRPEEERGNDTPPSRRTIVVERQPDPPTPLGGDTRRDGSHSVSLSSLPTFDDPPSCQSSDSESVRVNAPTPTRGPFSNYMGVDPPVGLLGGCIYMD